ncbi:condensin II non structural maintenance of chromosomes domain containing protein [Nitzschia inconspicua]|uniref:Condensin II non structural maintenance of chromosomes domain containing protein n=1 Tax=Nitzschia inconspicua TaxID=303405 RepID=A0A9K3KWH6_9STRA|nr:condensin II non structural maintenance of chromosomes domain containing protein [Nitzschia inconspicua]
MPMLSFAASAETTTEVVAIKALLSAVDGGSDNRVEGDKYNIRNLLRLFEPVKRKDALIAGNTSKQQTTLLLRSLQTCNKGQLKRFFNNVQSIVECVIVDEAYLLPTADETDLKEDSSKEDAKSKECLRFLEYVVMCVQAVLDSRILRRQQDSLAEDQSKNLRATKQLKMPSPVIDVALSMHDILFGLHSSGIGAVSTENAVLNLCETWWLANGERREALIVQCLPLLVLRACDEEDCFTNKTHIQRLYKLRDAFHCIDFADQSSDSLRKLVLRVASNPLCIKLPEGKKLLSSLMQDGDLVRDLHLAFRAQIPAAKDTVLEAYGEIYHRAWKDARESPSHDEISEDNNIDSKPIRQIIEEEVLQDLMYSVIHLASPKTFNAVLKVLEPLHVDKKNKDVAGMLYRLYNPILWRSLAATNPTVRHNAVLLLEKVFPLNDPHHVSGQNSTKESVLKGLKALRDALADVDPIVRAVASKASCGICAVFWEALPAGEIRNLLQVIVLEHSSDKGSAAVRVASVEAISMLLGSDQSHGVLRALLPSVGNLIHDRAERVRLAVVRMLIRIKTIPGIRFYHVVPVDQLLARLVAEAEYHGGPRTNVAKELTALLLNSYFPQGEKASGGELLKRTVSLLLTNPNASAIFYANVMEYLEVESVVKLILALSNCLKSAVTTDQAAQLNEMRLHKKRQHSRSSKMPDHRENGGTKDFGPHDQVSADDTTLMAALSNTINVLWESVLEKLDKHSESPHKQALKGMESEMNAAENERSIESFQTCTSLLACAGRLDKKAVNEVVAHVSSTLKNIPKDPSESYLPLVASYLSFLCSSGYVVEVARCVSESIKLSFGEEDCGLLSPALEGISVRRRNSRRLSKKVNEDSLASLSPSMAWSIIDGFLQGMNNECVQGRKSILNSDVALSAVLEAFRKGIQHAERILTLSRGSFGTFPENDEAERIISACEAYGRLALHKETVLSLKNDTDARRNRELALLLQWTTNVVVPALAPCEQGSAPLPDLDISHISTASDSGGLLPPRSPNLTSPPKQKQNRGRTPESMRVHMTSSFPSRGHSTSNASMAFAASILASSCFISSEWLAAGVSEPGAITEASLLWCDVFEDLDACLVDAIFPAFIRLGVHLKRVSGSTALLQKLFVVCNKYIETEDSNCFMIAMETARSLLGRQSHDLDSFVTLFLNIAELIIPSEQQVVVQLESSEHLVGLWQKGGSMAIFLDLFDSSRIARRHLADALASSMSLSGDENNPLHAFKVNCLSVLSNTMGRGAVAEIFENLGTEIPQGGNGDANVMNVLVKSRG